MHSAVVHVYVLHNMLFSTPHCDAAALRQASGSALLAYRALPSVASQPASPTQLPHTALPLHVRLAQHIPSQDVETLPSGMLEPAAASGEHPRVTAAKQRLQQRLKEQAQCVEGWSKGGCRGMHAARCLASCAVPWHLPRLHPHSPSPANPRPSAPQAGGRVQGRNQGSGGPVPRVLL